LRHGVEEWGRGLLIYLKGSLQSCLGRGKKNGLSLLWVVGILLYWRPTVDCYAIYWNWHFKKPYHNFITKILDL